MSENKDKTNLNLNDLDGVSGGQKVTDYYNKPVMCSCGCDEFTNLGWDDARHGYNVKCNYCGNVTFVYR